MRNVVLINLAAAWFVSTHSVASSYDDYAIKPAETQLSNQQQKVDEPISFLPIPISRIKQRDILNNPKSTKEEKKAEKRRVDLATKHQLSGSYGHKKWHQRSRCWAYYLLG